MPYSKRWRFMGRKSERDARQFHPERHGRVERERKGGGRVGLGRRGCDRRPGDNKHVLAVAWLAGRLVLVLTRQGGRRVLGAAGVADDLDVGVPVRADAQDQPAPHHRAEEEEEEHDDPGRVPHVTTGYHDSRAVEGRR